MNRLRISKGGREFLMPLTSNTSSNQTLSVLNSTTCTDGTSEISSNVTVDSSSQDGGDLNRSVDSTIATDINLGTLDDMSAVNLTGVKSGNLASGEPGNLAETESEKLNFEDAHGYIVATTGGLNIVSSGDAGNDKQEAPSDLTEVVTLDSTSSLNHGDTEQSLHQNQVDGVLSNSSTILLPENLVLFETSKGLVFSMPSQESSSFSSSFVTSGVDSQTLITSSMGGTIFPQIQLVGSGDDSGSSVYETVSDTGTILIPSTIFPDTDPTQTLVVGPLENDDKPKRKGTGGWPKGKKRKNEPTVNMPRKPMTGYVIFAVKRRQEMKTERPDLTFPEITKHMGQEWSNFTEEEKDKYMRLAEEDKQRYITEMKEFQESDQYQQFVRNKRQAGGMLNGLSQNDKPLIDIDDNIGEELYCRLCNQFFISAHNKREHMFGRQHLQNITNEIRKDIQEQEDTQKQQLLMAADDLDPYTLPEQTVVTLETDDLHSDNSASLDIDDFIHKFWEKNAYREKEVHTLKKANRSFADDNLLMTKQIKELEELETKLTHDLGSLKAYGSSLSAQVDSLKMVPTLFGVINF
ncbi:uncharacterized protein LOC128211957 [Mya arenaria]|uniref:uncharacterized protein LOC128211957 n=1 Tax=Mya arenaria TaxID=6604 RepID=UPI0022E1D0C0|nr:uncharacterized protein LOC128211957 [Mya arenaria]